MIAMLAVRIHEFGPRDVIRVEDSPIPAPGAGEVLVRVHASGVGPWDALIRSGRSALGQSLPLTLGSDLAGKIESIGVGVAGFAVGDEIYGVTNPQFIGANAQYAVASAAKIARKPRDLSFPEAASVPVIAVTAWQMLFDHAHVVAGQNVLIHGAAGNVGAYAAQLARRSRANVFSSARTTDLGELSRLGIDQGLDSERLDALDNRMDAVIDTIGGDTQRRLFALLKPGGILVSAVSQPDEHVALERGIRAVFFYVDVTTAALTGLAELLSTRQLVTRVGALLPIQDALKAHEMLEGARQKPQGKIVLEVG
jgi:NADPH:quinone reductase-like Zn-dependent oxidoreductase